MGQIIDMNLQLEQDERIDSYLRGQMSKEEEILFENDLRGDAVLRRRARFIAKAIKTMKKAETKEEGLMSLPQTVGFRMVARKPNTKGKNKK